jgi:hypothetical protein
MFDNAKIRSKRRSIEDNQRQKFIQRLSKKFKKTLKKDKGPSKIFKEILEFPKFFKNVP